MFYSQLLLSKTGPLGIVWMAAHCHKRLKKHQIQQTDISSSVDKILDDEIRVITHRILAFLLLGIVRIYSKKVEYLLNDCHEIVNRLRSYTTGKSKRSGIGVSQTHYHSISLPRRFDLDTFDLDLLEDQDVVGGNVRSYEQEKLADGCKKDVSLSGLLYKKNVGTSGAYTPPRDVFGPHHICQDLFVVPSNNNISLAGMEVLRGTCFSLEDRLDPLLLDKIEEEQMHNKLPDEDLNTNVQGSIDDMESDSVVSPSNNIIHLSPRLEILRGTAFDLEDRLEPMELDEAEKEQLDGRTTNHNINSDFRGPIQDAEFDYVANHQSPKGSDSVASLVALHETGLSLERLPNLKMLNETEKGLGHDNLPDGELRLEEDPVKDLSTQLNFQEGEHHDFTASIDRAKPVDMGIKVVEVISQDNVKWRRPEEFHVSVVTPESKLPAGLGTSEVSTVQTPGRKERAKILKKRKMLDLTMVVTNKEFKKWIDDPTDLKRKRRNVPDTVLGAWRASKHAHLPQSISEPSIPGISVDLGNLKCKRSRAPAIKTVDLSNEQNNVNSPVRYGAGDQISDVRSPVLEKSHDQTPIAPGTPTAHLNPLRSNEGRAVADSDILESITSYESIENCPSSSEALGLDNLFDEETSSFEGDSLEKVADAYSAITRKARSYLGRKFEEQKRGKEEALLNLSHLLEGKSKKESARLFYEILVLKMRECIDVQQEAAYSDILLREMPKLRHIEA